MSTCTQALLVMSTDMCWSVWEAAETWNETYISSNRCLMWFYSRM